MTAQLHRLLWKTKKIVWLSVWTEVQIICMWSNWYHCRHHCMSKLQHRFIFLEPTVYPCWEEEFVRDLYWTNGVEALKAVGCWLVWSLIPSLSLKDMDTAAWFFPSLLFLMLFSIYFVLSILPHFLFSSAFLCILSMSSHCLFPFVPSFPPCTLCLPAWMVCGN